MPLAPHMTLASSPLRWIAFSLGLAAYLSPALSTSALARTFYVNAATGSDSAGDGSSGSPYKTWAKVKTKVAALDVVYFATGDYGDLVEGTGPSNVFPNWVTLQSAPGNRARFGSIRVGANGGAYFPSDRNGSFDAYLRFKELDILNGVEIYGARKVEVVDCRIEREGPWAGSAEDIEKVAVNIRGAVDTTVSGCEITRTGVAVAAAGRRISILGNHIHDITHDGIRAIGLEDSLVANNRIHGLDDGVTDAEATWSRHCDAIQIFISGTPTAEQLIANSNVTFRGNIIYDIESQGVQFNNYFRFADIHNNNITFENNIFGPTGAIAFNNADPCDGLIIRNNTFITGTRTYTSPNNQSHRVITCSNSILRIGDDSTNIHVYNNILGSATGSHPNAVIYDYNIIQVASTAAFSRFTVASADPLFVDPFAFDGVLRPGAAAIDAGTRTYRLPPPATDRVGTTRDNRPDMGAYEVPGRSPAAEAPALPDSGAATVFVDDFEDSNFDRDPYLNGPGRQGLSFQHAPESASYFSFVRSAVSRNRLKSPIVGGLSSYLLSTQGSAWTRYTFSFSATNAYITSGCGPLFFVKDAFTAYGLDLGKDAGQIVRRMRNSAGVPETKVLANLAKLALPNSGSKTYTIWAMRNANSIVIQVDVDSDGTIDLSYTDTDPTALATFLGGGIGFFKEYAFDNHNISFDDVVVTLLPTSPPTNAKVKIQ